MHAYLINGTLPDPGTICKPEDLLSEGGVERKARRRDGESEDERILQAVRGLGEMMRDSWREMYL